MSEFLLAVAGFILLTVAVGLVRLLWGPDSMDRLMVVQLFGTGGIAALVLIAAGAGLPPALDVAVTVALVSAMAAVAFAKGAGGKGEGG